MTAKVLILGMGAVGTVGAYALKHKGLSEVTSVVRSAYDTLTTTGFDIESIDYGNIKGFKPDHVAKSAEEAMTKYGPFDFILVTMKNIPDISPIEELLEKCYTPKTGIVLLQNGIGIEKPVFERFPEARVVSGTTVIYSTLYNNVVKQPGHDKPTFGPFINPNLPEDVQIETCKKFVELYSNPDNDVSYEPDVKYTRWMKLVYNATLNTTCALTGVDTGRLDMFKGTDTIVRPAMSEILAIAKADGVELPETLPEKFIRYGDGLYYPPSMLMDARKGRYTEYEVIIANVIAIANELHVPCPTLTVMANLLHVIQMRTMEEKGKFNLPEKRPPITYKIEMN